MTRLVALTIVVLVTVGVAGCGDDDAASPIAATAATPDGGGTIAAEATFNDADVAFAQGMVPHHRQAVEMADLALDPAAGASEAVLDLATRVKSAQDPEIVVMTGWLQQWGAPVTADSADGHDMSDMSDDGDMAGMMSDEEMDALAGTQGADFDRLWVEMMIEHHRGAITMAEIEQADGVSSEAVALAGEIVAAQQAEVDEMTALLDQLS